MPKAKKKPAPEGNGPPGVQWAPISTVHRAPMPLQPPPLPPSTSTPTTLSPAAPPPAPGVPPSGQSSNTQRAQPPVLPSNASTGHHVHHHYIPTPTGSGRNTPTHTRGSSTPIAHPDHGPSFPRNEHSGPAVLPSIESPDLGNRQHTHSGPGGGYPNVFERISPPPTVPVQHQQYPPPGYYPNVFERIMDDQIPLPPKGSIQHQQNYPARDGYHVFDRIMNGETNDPIRLPPTLPVQHQQHHHPHHPHHPPPKPPYLRPLTDDEIRRLQRFMSLNWRVGVINHPPFARRNNPFPPPPPPPGHGTPGGHGHGERPGPGFAGFVGQAGQVYRGSVRRPH